eukprot:64654-Pyramimonas_sp.AAC.1
MQGDTSPSRPFSEARSNLVATPSWSSKSTASDWGGGRNRARAGSDLPRGVFEEKQTLNVRGVWVVARSAAVTQRDLSGEIP